MSLGECPFSELEFFDVGDCWPPDIMHDLLEGIMPYVIKLTLSKLIQEHHFTLEILNNCNEMKFEMASTPCRRAITIHSTSHFFFFFFREAFEDICVKDAGAVWQTWNDV